MINPSNNGDKLMYYNRVLTAELKDPKSESDNYLITPPDDSKFQTPARYDFSNDPNANVSILSSILARIFARIFMIYISASSFTKISMWKNYHN